MLDGGPSTNSDSTSAWKSIAPFDIAFRAGKIIEPNLVARQVGTSCSTLMASPAYLAARGVPLTLADLAEHDCISFPKQSGPASWSLNGPEGNVEANTVQVLLHATLANLGISLLPTIMAAPHLHTGRLQEVLPGYGVTGLASTPFTSAASSCRAR